MTTATIPTYPIAIQDVVGSGGDGCSVLSLVLFLWRELQGQRMGEDL